LALLWDYLVYFSSVRVDKNIQTGFETIEEHIRSKILPEIWLLSIFYGFEGAKFSIRTYPRIGNEAVSEFP
jgi:hypothetical protein